MPNVVLNHYSTYVERLQSESGDRSCPIWILVNPKYPTDISTIWNPIMYEIQDIVYRKLHARINNRNIFIKPAVSDIIRVSNTSMKEEIDRNTDILRESLLEYQPKLLITFGAITHEFLNRIFFIKPENKSKYWSTGNLGDEFDKSIKNFDINHINWLPLARRIPKAYKNLKDWEESNSHYRGVAAMIAERIVENKDSLDIWI